MAFGGNLGFSTGGSRDGIGHGSRWAQTARRLPARGRKLFGGLAKCNHIHPAAILTLWGNNGFGEVSGRLFWKWHSHIIAPRYRLDGKRAA